MLSKVGGQQLKVIAKFFFIIAGPPHLERVPCPEVDGHEGQPDDAGRVHGEADELGLVEVLGDLPGLDGVEGADGDENHVVHLRDEEGGVGHVALQDDLLPVRVDLVRRREGGEHPEEGGAELDGHQRGRDHQLRLGADVGGPEKAGGVEKEADRGQRVATTCSPPSFF